MSNLVPIPHSKQTFKHTKRDTGEVSFYDLEEMIVEPTQSLSRGPNLGKKVLIFSTSAAAIRKMKLNGTEQDLLSRLLNGMYFDTGRIDFSPTKLAREHGISREHLSRIKSKFIEAKIIIVRAEGNDYINSRVAWRGKDQWLCAEWRKSDPFLVIPQKKKRKPKCKKSAEILQFKKA
jgi:hypothetical protein